jgi:hypothetical protein
MKWSHTYLVMIVEWTYMTKTTHNYYYYPTRKSFEGLSSHFQLTDEQSGHGDIDRGWSTRTILNYLPQSYT